MTGQGESTCGLRCMQKILTSAGSALDLLDIHPAVTGVPGRFFLIILRVKLWIGDWSSCKVHHACNVDPLPQPYPDYVSMEETLWSNPQNIRLY